MRYLSLSEVIELHRRIMDQSSGASGLRDLGGLESAIAQPRMIFGGQDLYPTLIEKAGALCFSLIQNHPFVDGNKRIGHAAMEVFLILNGHEIQASVDDQENLILGVASSQVTRDNLIAWLTDHVFEQKE
jgi:death on curing protein